MMDRVYNVEKGRKRKASDDDSLPKRGRPKKLCALSLRYPVITSDGKDKDVDSEQALEKEIGKDKPRKEVVMSLMKNTFYFRRQYILHSEESVITKLGKHSALRIPYVVSLFHMCTKPFHILCRLNKNWNWYCPSNPCTAPFVASGTRNGCRPLSHTART